MPIVSASEDAQPFLGARVYNAGNLTAQTATWLTVTFDTEAYDTAAIHSPTVNPERLTSPVTAYYLITHYVEFDANATGVRRVSVSVNGQIALGTGTLIGYTIIPNIGAFSDPRGGVATVYRLAAGDYVTTGVQQDSGGPLDIVGVAAAAFSMSLLGA